MSSKTFGQLLKALRQETGKTMREFCLEHGFDPGNYSRLERGLFPPPQRDDLLEKYATALGIARGSDDWLEFFDVAAAARGQIPKDLASDEALVGKLPALFRTLRGRPIPPDQLDHLIDEIRRS
jgi:transcriptional regulator with XRE-family HTH domain